MLLDLPASSPIRLPACRCPDRSADGWKRAAGCARAESRGQVSRLLEQIPAVVFMAYLDRGISEAYVSPQIEAALGFSQEEWLEDPVRWYRHIHPDDKLRWSEEAAEMFLSGKPLRSAYRVIARDGHVVWFHCEAKMVRGEDGHPWFIHGVAFDITELKQSKRSCRRSATSSRRFWIRWAPVVVLDPEGRIVRFNRACELTTGYSMEEVQGKCIWDLFLRAEEAERFRAHLRAAAHRSACHRTIKGAG